MNDFYTKIFNKLGIIMHADNPTFQLLHKALNRLDQIRTINIKKKTTREYKAKRVYHDKARMKEEIYQNRTSEKKYGTYQTGIVFECPDMGSSTPAAVVSSFLTYPFFFSPKNSLTGCPSDYESVFNK